MLGTSELFASYLRDQGFEAKSFYGHIRVNIRRIKWRDVDIWISDGNDPRIEIDGVRHQKLRLHNPESITFLLEILRELDKEV
jgi:hypothetical protein